jgi:hypothetical protein
MSEAPKTTGQPTGWMADHPTFDPAAVRVLLWSKSQNCFHQETLLDMLETNTRAFQEDRHMDFVPLIIGDETVVDALADELRPMLRERQEREGQGDAE